MAVEKSYARLGLFLVIVFFVMLATAFFFVQRMKHREVITVVTYTNENVSGLDVSSPVRYRGVPIGRVSDVRVDTHKASIEISFELFVDRLTSFGLDVKRIQADGGRGMASRLQAQVVSNPVTGEAYLLLDRRPDNAPPPVALGFTPDRAYVPSVPTVISKVQDRLPEILEHAETTLKTLREIISKVPDSLDRSNQFLNNFEQILKDSQLPALSADSRQFLATTSTQLAQIEKTTSELTRLIEAGEKVARMAEETRSAVQAADLPATSQSARDTLDRTSLAADDLRRALPAMRDSLEQIRRLARLIEEQPESVVYGPRNSGRKP